MKTLLSFCVVLLSLVCPLSGQILPDNLQPTKVDCIYSSAPGWQPCVQKFNCIDRWNKNSPEVEVDNRGNEIGYHTPKGGYHGVIFLAPQGYVTRIVRYDLDVVAKWTGQGQKSSSDSAWGLMSLHNQSPDWVGILEPLAEFINFDRSYKHLVHRDTIKWIQMPVADIRNVVQNYSVANGLLLNNELWVKHAMFNNVTGREMQIETTGEFYFWFEPAGLNYR